MVRRRNPRRIPSCRTLEQLHREQLYRAQGELSANSARILKKGWNAMAHEFYHVMWVAIAVLVASIILTYVPLKTIL